MISAVAFAPVPDVLLHLGGDLLRLVTVLPADLR